VRTILHVDMDAFFAAIEQRDHPEWRGRPVVVGAPPDRRGVVSTASYEARAFGIHSAMPSRTAGRLCPHAIFVHPRMALYQQESERLMAILESYTPDVEAVSVDEAFLDLSSVLHLWPDIPTLARSLHERIPRELGGLTASIGVAPNKFLAKVASDLCKPNGLLIVPTDPEAIRLFLAPLPVSRLFGVGPITRTHLEKVGIRTIGDVQALAESSLAACVGPSMAQWIRALAFGQDDRPVVTEWEEKSLSRETTFETDCADRPFLRQTLIALAESVGHRLRARGRLARTAFLKLRFPDFRTITRQKPLPEPTDSDRGLIQSALRLFEEAAIQGPLRLIGFGVQNLTDSRLSEPFQPDLFTAGELARRRERERRLDHMVDTLRQRFGKESLRRGLWHRSSQTSPDPGAGEED